MLAIFIGSKQDIIEANISEQLSKIAKAVKEYYITDAQIAEVVTRVRKELGLLSAEDNDEEYLQSQTPCVLPFEQHDPSPETNNMRTKTTRSAAAGRATMYKDAERRVQKAQTDVVNA
ncbi:MAG: hypothetical protein WC244_04155 [Patescibacteria group bacterium]